MHIKIHEDNVGALILGKLEPQRMTPRSKHYAVKYHWFREHIGPRNIQLVKISSEDQLGNLFTKGLSQVSIQDCESSLWAGKIHNLFRGGVWQDFSTYVPILPTF